jgi:threonine/homoserine/homoserine lactone efflux protein
MIHLYHLSYIGKGFLLNIINIGVFIFWLGLVIVFTSKYEMNYTKTNTFLAYVLGIYLALDVVKIILAKQLKPLLTPRILYKLKQWVHVIVVLFGLFFMFQGIFPEQKQKLETKIEERLK